MYSSFNFLILTSSPRGLSDWWGMGGGGGVRSPNNIGFSYRAAHVAGVSWVTWWRIKLQRISPQFWDATYEVEGRKPAKIQSYRDSIPDLCDTGRALYPINWWSPLKFVSSSRTSNSSYSFIYYLIEVYATGIFFLSFQVLQYVQNMYLKFKHVNYIAKPIFLSSKLANLPSRMSALSRGQNDKYDVQRFGVT